MRDVVVVAVLVQRELPGRPAASIAHTMIVAARSFRGYRGTGAVRAHRVERDAIALHVGPEFARQSLLGVEALDVGAVDGVARAVAVVAGVFTADRDAIVVDAARAIVARRRIGSQIGDASR